MRGIDPDDAPRDLFEVIKRGEFPKWSVKSSPDSFTAGRQTARPSGRSDKQYTGASKMSGNRRWSDTPANSQRTQTTEPEVGPHKQTPGEG